MVTHSKDPWVTLDLSHSSLSLAPGLDVAAGLGNIKRTKIRALSTKARLSDGSSLTQEYEGFRGIDTPESSPSVSFGSVAEAPAWS